MSHRFSRIGDIGVKDEQSYILVVYRSKDIVISGDSISSDDFGAFLGAGTGRSRRS
jgi:hypothetical protein